MDAADRKSLSDVTENKCQVFNELFSCLRNIHKVGYVHCDIRPSNCLHFPSGWQLADFDHAVSLQCEEAQDSDRCGTAVMYKNTSQLTSCGESLLMRHEDEIREAVHDDAIAVQVYTWDDIEMLAKAVFGQKK